MSEAAATARKVTLHVAGRTDVGLVREHNEDSFVVIDLGSGELLDVNEMRTVELSAKGAVLVVCDGMGGAAAGEIASAMAVDAVREVMNKLPEVADADEEARKISFARRLRSAAYTANERIFQAAHADLEKVGMGTTLTAVGVSGLNLVIAQVGDSRAYLLRQGTLTQLTRDQSLVNELLESGQITEEQAATFEHSNVILQALGVQSDVEVLLSTVALRRDDRLIVCSDGLTGVVADEEVGALSHVSEDMGEVGRLLVEVARGAGGPDNITAIVARFDGEDLQSPSEADAPVAYMRWRLDEPELGATTPTPRSLSPIRARAGAVVAPRPARAMAPSFALTFFSAMVLFVLAIGSLFVGAALQKADAAGAGETCTVAGEPGLSIRLDGFDTGAETQVGGVSLRLPQGRHHISLRGAVAPTTAQELTIAAGRPCLVDFSRQVAGASR